ncbi:MAG: hypothetical protein M1389_04085 [Chloroflexi bacterium]|nr:hypothetical protein [Chloroflexota bacterium]
MGRLLFGAGLLALLWLVSFEPASPPANARAPWWEFQSIDTMKSSRDLSREKLEDPSFDAVIEQQIADIADTGATHVGLATPYDEEFVPFLRRWVAAARKHGLKVWFRGNWSGWEGWFGYPPVSRQEHLQKTVRFIYTHPDLFQDGDVFSGCPECENGGPGDPRLTGDVAGHRRFLIQEYAMSREAFRRIGKRVAAIFNPMNGDVARLVMDKNTTRRLGGIVVIDHYVRSPQQLAADVREIARTTGGRIVLGEFGAPIPDIHGALSDGEQAAWVQSALDLLADVPEVAGINYWTNVGGSTELWIQPGKPRQAAAALKSYFIPEALRGVVRDTKGRGIGGAHIVSADRRTRTVDSGEFTLPYVRSTGAITAVAAGYVDRVIDVRDELSSYLEISLEAQDAGFFARAARFLGSLALRTVDTIAGLQGFVCSTNAGAAVGPCE